MPDVFVSYAHEDVDVVRELVHELDARGLSVFWDEDIRRGRRFDTAIEAELDACRCILVCWSRHSADSNWVRAEAQEGLDRNCLVAVTLDGTRGPLQFRLVNTADLVGWPDRSAGPELQAICAGAMQLAGRQVASVNSSELSFVLPQRHVGTLSERVALRVVSQLSSHDLPLHNRLERERGFADLFQQLLLAPPRARAEVLLDGLCTLFAGARGGLWVEGDLRLAAPVREWAALAASSACRDLLGADGVQHVHLDTRPQLASEGLSWLTRVPGQRNPAIVLMLAGVDPLEGRDLERVRGFGAIVDMLEM